MSGSDRDLWPVLTIEVCERGVFAFRKASLALIRKMVHYSSEVLLKEVCDSESGHNLPTVLVEITATVLDQEVRVLQHFRCLHY